MTETLLIVGVVTAMVFVAVLLMAGGTLTQMFQVLLLGPRMSKTGGKKMVGLAAKVSMKDQVFLKELLEAGKITPVIDRCYPLSETAEALRYLGQGHARGKVVIQVVQNNQCPSAGEK